MHLSFRRWGRATIDIISCQQIIEQHWFNAKCRELTHTPATRDSQIRAFNWFNLVPPWVSDDALQAREHSWAPPLPNIAWTSASVMGSEKLATPARGSTPIPDGPADGEINTPWVIDESDYGKQCSMLLVYQCADCSDIPEDWLDEGLCGRNLTLFVKLASGPRCFKKEWNGLNVKVRLTPQVPPTGNSICVQILTDKLVGRAQFQEVPKRSLIPTRPTHVKQKVMILSGHSKGDLGCVVCIEGDAATIGPLDKKATPRNTAQHNLSNLIVIVDK